MKIRTLFVAVSMILTSAAFADTGTYKVTITNITKGIPAVDGEADLSKGIQFTPVLAASHTNEIAYFSVGQAALPQLADLAEGGATGPLRTVLESLPELVTDIDESAGLLLPGAYTELELTADSKSDYLSFASMLLPTNDTFVAVNSVAFPKKGSATYYARAYDAGSEYNDELCDNIPGPRCGGAGGSPDMDGEGYVYPSAGIHGEGELSVKDHDWNDPVAKVVIERIDK